MQVIITEYTPHWPELAHTGLIGAINPRKGKSTNRVWTKGAVRPHTSLEVVVHTDDRDEALDALAEAGLFATN